MVFRVRERSNERGGQCKRKIIRPEINGCVTNSTPEAETFFFFFLLFLTQSTLFMMKNVELAIEILNIFHTSQKNDFFFYLTLTTSRIK